MIAPVNFIQLPPEIKEEISSHLSPKDCYNAALTCKTFAAIILDRVLDRSIANSLKLNIKIVKKLNKTEIRNLFQGTNISKDQEIFEAFLPFALPKVDEEKLKLLYADAIEKFPLKTIDKMLAIREVDLTQTYYKVFLLVRSRKDKDFNKYLNK